MPPFITIAILIDILNLDHTDFFKTTTIASGVGLQYKVTDDGLHGLIEYGIDLRFLGVFINFR